MGFRPMGIPDGLRILFALRAELGLSTPDLALRALLRSGICALVGSAVAGAGFDLAALGSLDEADAPP